MQLLCHAERKRLPRRSPAITGRRRKVPRQKLAQ